MAVSLQVQGAAHEPWTLADPRLILPFHAFKSEDNMKV